MTYKIKIDKEAAKFISKQPKPQRIRILSAIYRLPDDGDIKAMKTHNNLYRLRVGSYRIIYSVHNDALVIEVVAAGNRGDIYKQIQ